MGENSKEFSMMLNDITIFRKEIDAANKILAEIPDLRKHNFIFEYSMSLFADKNKSIIGTISRISVFTDEEKQNRFAYFEIGIAFTIVDFENYVLEEKIMVPDNALAVMISSSIGTSRGILFCEFKGTALATINLPLIQTKPIADNIKKKIASGLDLVK